jgi:SPP1 gp7 family putative phage head morphogenesis protein
MPHYCFNQSVNELPDVFSEDEANDYIERIYTQIITTEALSLGYHKKVAKILLKPIIDELGDPEKLGADLVRAEMSRRLQNSVYEFSAAKQYQQARTMSKLITPSSSFPEFKKAAGRVFDQYNKNWLKTEYDTAVATSQSAKQFAHAMDRADDFNYIRYKTQNDGRVRPVHAELNDITLPVNHPFWRRYYPPNGWNCRCFTITLEDAPKTELNEIDLQKVRDSTPDLFRQNAALTGKLFDPTKHPYFEIERGDAALRDRNFNLPLG